MIKKWNTLGISVKESDKEKEFIILETGELGKDNGLGTLRMEKENTVMDQGKFSKDYGEMDIGLTPIKEMQI